jgi:hypothetical protein
MSWPDSVAAERHPPRTLRRQVMNCCLGAGQNNNSVTAAVPILTIGKLRTADLAIGDEHRQRTGSAVYGPYFMATREGGYSAHVRQICVQSPTRRLG